MMDIITPTPNPFAMLKLESPEAFEAFYQGARSPQVMEVIRLANERYLHWDKFQHRPIPKGYTHEQMWTYIHFSRTNRKAVPFNDKRGRPFTYWIPDSMLRELNTIDTRAGRNILTDHPWAIPSKERYVVNSLMEEAIASSQLEGAATTRTIAKEMLRTGRKPADINERMILNNWKTMLHIRDHTDMKLSIEALCETHSIIADQTIEHPEEVGTLRNRDDVVVMYNDQEIHMPPKHDLLPARMQALCDFANDDSEDNWIHPVIKAAILHFWIGYDHPFADGNGRTARAIFYWYLLSKGYVLFEYLPISRYFLRGPSQYMRAYLYSEEDGNDLTYFIFYNLKAIRIAFEELEKYMRAKKRENQQAGILLRSYRGLNMRQKSLLFHAIQHPDSIYTIKSQETTYSVSYETARSDLLRLEKKGLLNRAAEGREFLYRPSDRLFELLRSGPIDIGKEQAVRMT